MTTAVTLTPDADTASVLIEITGAPNGALTILRTDANGSNTVRLSEGQVPISGALTVRDYECALLGTLSYEIKDSLLAVVTATTTLQGVVTRPWFNVARLPQSNIELLSVLDYSSNRQGSSTVHYAIDRADPVVVIGNLRLRRGTMQCLTTSYADARGIEGTCDLGEVLMVRQTDFLGLDMYFIADTVSVQPDAASTNPRRWRVDIQYIEVAVPIGSLLGALGWDFEALASEYATFAEARDAFVDFAAMVAGP